MNDDFQHDQQHEYDFSRLEKRLKNKNKEKRIRILEAEIRKAPDRSTKTQLQALLDSEKGNSKKKIPIIIGSGMILLAISVFAVYFLFIRTPDDTPDQAGSSSSSTASDTAVSSSSSTSSEISESSSVAESSSTTESSESDDLANFPYAVPVSALGDRTFYYSSSVNTPNSVKIDFQGENTGTAEFLFERADGTNDITIFSVTYQSIPTTDKRVFIDGSVENLKSVKVNTEIVFGDVIRDDFNRASDYSSYDSMYVFYNGDGGVSLLTPNYAGNVPTEGDKDIMIELRG